MHRRHYTCMRFPLRQNRSIHAFAPLFYTIKLSSTPNGILFSREVSCFVVALVQSTHGPQIGEMLRTIILKWLSVLGYPQVSVSCISKTYGICWLCRFQKNSTYDMSNGAPTVKVLFCWTTQHFVALLKLLRTLSMYLNMTKANWGESVTIVCLLADASHHH